MKFGSVVFCLTFAYFWAGGSAQDLAALSKKIRQWNYTAHLPSELDHDDSAIIAAMEAVQKMQAFWRPENFESIYTQASVGGKYGNISAECIKGYKHLLNGTDDAGLPLLLYMLDATGKPGAGYKEGNIYASGSYDECLDIGPGDTEYCTGYMYVGVNTPVLKPITLVYSMCVPKGCTTYDITIAILDGTAAHIYSDPTRTTCVSTRKPPFTAGAIIMILVCFLFVVLMMAATVIDFMFREFQAFKTDGNDMSSSLSEKAPLLAAAPDPAKPTKSVSFTDVLTTFSLLKVLPQILSTKQPPSAITSINGLRVISMFWVILCHTHYWVLLNGAQNVYRIEGVLSRFTFQAIGNAFFSVDSFFFLSGLLVAYLTFREMKRKKGQFPFLTYYLHRYLRLTPTYAFVLFFSWLLTMHLADGPTYHLAAWQNSTSYQNCKSYWWTNLLYINNFYPWRMEEECIGWTWYLSNDMQFYIFSPLIIIPMYFLFPIGLVLSAGVLAVSIAVSGTLAGVYHHQANTFAQVAYNFIPNNTNATTYNNLQYIKPWHRVAPYIVGLVLGYILYRLRLPTKRFLCYFIFPILMILSGIFLVSTLYGLYPQWHGHVPSKAENVIYIMFSRFTWSLGLALLVFACHYGYGGPINWLLSMKFWIPLSRVSYNAYLIHPLILTVIFGSERKPIYYKDYNLAVYAIGIIILSFAAAAVVSVFVEFPIGNLEQVLFKLVGLGRQESARTGGEEPRDNTEHLRVESSLNTRPFVGSSTTSINTAKT